MITDTSLIDRTIYVDLVPKIIEIQRPTVLRHELCMQWEGCEWKSFLFEAPHAAHFRLVLCTTFAVWDIFSEITFDKLLGLLPHRNIWGKLLRCSCNGTIIQVLEESFALKN